MTPRHSRRQADGIELWADQQQGPTRYNCPRCTDGHFATRQHQLAHISHTHTVRELLEQLWEDIQRLEFSHPQVPDSTITLAGQITAYECPLCDTTTGSWRAYLEHAESHGAATLYKELGPDLPAVIDEAPGYTSLGYSGVPGSALELLPGDRVTIAVTDYELYDDANPLADSSSPWNVTGLVETIPHDFRDICRPLLAPPFAQPQAALEDIGVGTELRELILTADINGDPQQATPWSLTVTAPEGFPSQTNRHAPLSVSLSQGLSDSPDTYSKDVLKIADATVAGISRSPWYQHAVHKGPDTQNGRDSPPA